MRFVVLHFGLAKSIVNAKGKVGLANSRLSVLGANVGRGVLAEFSSIFLHSVKAMITITLVTRWGTTISFILCNAFGSVQTNMISTWTNLQFVFALKTKVTVRADTVFKELRVSDVVVFHFFSKGVEKRIVFLALATRSSVLAIQGTIGICSIVKFATWSTIEISRKLQKRKR